MKKKTTDVLFILLSMVAQVGCISLFLKYVAVDLYLNYFYQLEAVSENDFFVGDMTIIAVICTAVAAAIMFKKIYQAFGVLIDKNEKKNEVKDQTKIEAAN